MTNAAVAPDQATYPNNIDAWRQAQQTVGLLTGQAAWSFPVALTGLDDDDAYALTVLNQGATGLHILVPGLFGVTNGGVVVGVLTVATLHVTANADIGGTLLVTGATTLGVLHAGATDVTTLHATGAVTFDATLNVTGTSTLGVVNAGATTVTTLHATGAATLDAALAAGATTVTTLHATGAATLDATLAAGATTVTTLHATGAATLDATLAAGATTVTTLHATGAATFDAASAFKHTVTIENGALTVLALFDVTAGAQTITLGPAGLPQFYADVANSRAIVGSTTALSSAADDRFSVIGGSLYVAANSTPTALGLRYTSSNTGSFYLGASNSNTPDGVLSNSGGTQLARLLTGGGLIVGTATAMSGAEVLRVQGSSRLEGGINVTTGSSVFAQGVTISSGGLTVTAGGSTFGASVTVSAGGIGVTGSSAFNTGVSIASGLTVTSGAVAFPNTTMAFYGAAGTAQPSIGGSRGGNAALGSLLFWLATLGLVVDLTTP